MWPEALQWLLFSCRKRQLEENVKQAEALTTLVGYKACLSTAEVHEFLKASNRPHAQQKLLLLGTALSNFVRPHPTGKRLRSTSRLQVE